MLIRPLLPVHAELEFSDNVAYAGTVAMPRSRNALGEQTTRGGTRFTPDALYCLASGQAAAESDKNPYSRDHLLGPGAAQEFGAEPTKNGAEPIPGPITSALAFLLRGEQGGYLRTGNLGRDESPGWIKGSGKKNNKQDTLLFPTPSPKSAAGAKQRGSPDMKTVFSLVQSKWTHAAIQAKVVTVPGPASV